MKRIKLEHSPSYLWLGLSGVRSGRLILSLGKEIIANHVAPLSRRPLLGGYLSHPAERFPRYFDIPFFVDNPYVLPCIVGSLFPFTGALIGFFFLEETLKPTPPSLPTKTDRRSAKRHGRFVAATSTTLPAPPEQRRLLEDQDDTDSGYSTPAARESRSDLRQISAEEMAAEGSGPVKPPPFSAMFTSRVLAALTTYVSLDRLQVSLNFEADSASFYLRRLSSRSKLSLSTHFSSSSVTLPFASVVSVRSSFVLAHRRRLLIVTYFSQASESLTSAQQCHSTPFPLSASNSSCSLPSNDDSAPSSSTDLS